MQIAACTAAPLWGALGELQLSPRASLGTPSVTLCCEEGCLGPQLPGEPAPPSAQPHRGLRTRPQVASPDLERGPRHGAIRLRQRSQGGVCFSLQGKGQDLRPAAPGACVDQCADRPWRSARRRGRAPPSMCAMEGTGGFHADPGGFHADPGATASSTGRS